MPECGKDMNEAVLPIEFPISYCSNEDRFIHISAWFQVSRSIMCDIAQVSLS
jgi:hypothetical protein